MKTIPRVTVNKDGRSRWKESTRDRVRRVSIRRGDDETTWSGVSTNNNGTVGGGANI